MFSGGPKEPLRSPKSTPKKGSRGQNRPRMGPKTSQEVPKTAQEGTHRAAREAQYEELELNIRALRPEGALEMRPSASRAKGAAERVLQRGAAALASKAMKN